MNIATMRCIALLALFAIMQCASSSPDSVRCPSPRLKNGRIRARGRGRIIRYTCYPGYELVGNKYSTCIRGSWDTPTPICVSVRCPPIPVPKHAVVGEKYHGAILMYFCEPGFVLVGNSEIYCDGRQWNGTTPYCRDSNAVAPTSCDFEKDGLCWWEQDPKHDFDWKKHRFDTPSSHIGTGPTHDHTLGRGNDGYYLYIEASGRLMNDTARIMSPFYPSNLTESGCFSFWYHMYGATIGSLNVYFKPEGEKTSKLMWTKSGNQGNQWWRGLFDLPTVNTSFQIIIEGVRGSSYVSDIAVDDIAILQGEECAVKNLSTTYTTAASDDEVEILNANQSCKDRCVTTLDTTTSPEVYSNPDVCSCTFYCAEDSTCCPDYAEYCIYEVVDNFETTASTTTEWALTSNNANVTEHTYESTVSKEYAHLSESVPVDVTKSTAPSTMASPVKTTIRITTQKATTINLMNESEKMTEAAITTSKEPITKTTVTRVETTVVSSTKEPTRLDGIDLTTIAYQKTSIASTDETITLKDDTKTEPQVSVQHARQMDQPTTLSLSGIIGIVIGTLTGLAITTFMAFVIFRKRKSCKRSSNGFSEDSDVRYLTSDEQLDFNLARPANEYEET